LDGTLILTDTLHELVIRLLREKPHLILALPIWLLSGKAALKQKITASIDLDIERLPFNKELINWIHSQKKLGRKLVLCTASDKAIAKKIATYLNLFDEVIASNGKINIAGKNKADTLVEKFGEKGFDYVGNSLVDLFVWRHSKKGIVVNGTKRTAQEARLVTDVELHIPKKKNDLFIWMKVLRLHQWIKNILIFVPIFTAHIHLTKYDWINLSIAFLSFSLCASAIYVINDLFDLESDRAHVTKQHRPFASGYVSIFSGIVITTTLLIASLLLAYIIEGSFFIWLLVYLVLTTAYSWGLKRLIIVDCITLATLYTLRIAAGAAVLSLTISFWLLTFSVFLFLSLAFIKRFAELQANLSKGVKNVHGRSYLSTDIPSIHLFGVASGYTSILVLALYINSENVSKLYLTPELIWAGVPLLLFWISWMWLQAQRGLMHEDPIVFAIKDKTSLLISIIFIGIFTIAHYW